MATATRFAAAVGLGCAFVLLMAAADGVTARNGGSKPRQEQESPKRAGDPPQDSSNPNNQDEPKSSALRELKPERFKELPAVSGEVSGAFQIGLLDIDNDGKQEMVIPDDHGSLLILSPDGSEPKRVTLGRRGLMRGVFSFEPVWKNGEMHWFAATGYGEPKVGLYSKDGTEIWSHAIGTGGSVFTKYVGSGDLDGDGKIELIAAWELMIVRETPAATDMRPGGAYIAVIDLSGKILCQRKVGKSLRSMQILPPRESGEPTTIVCAVDQFMAGAETIKGFHWRKRGKRE